MEQYVWKPQGIALHEQAKVGDIYQAFKLYVMPGLNNSDWIEDSKPVTDTGMRMREWAGLVLHALSLADLTKDTILIGKDFTGGDGVLMKTIGKRNYGVYVEQTLVTHRAHADLMTGIEERLKAKSDKGEGYSENKHLVIWLNINGDLIPNDLAPIIAKYDFNIVNIIGFNSANRTYSCYLYDRSKIKAPIHQFNIVEKDLVDKALET